MSPIRHRWIKPIAGMVCALGFVLALTSTPAQAGLIGWAVGNQQSIVHTDDGTNSSGWTTQTSPIERALNGVVFIDANQGWAVGNTFDTKGTIITTSNGGVTWVSQQAGMSADMNRDLFGVDFVDANNGWVVGGSGQIAATSNGGATWAQQIDIGAPNLNRVDFVDTQNGWVVGNQATIQRTSNGGTTWSAQTVPGAIGTDNLFGVSFVDVNNGWVVGADGDILRTSNGGTTWTQQTSGVTQNLNGVFFINATTGWAVGTNIGTNQRILTTTDGGTTWNIVPAASITLTTNQTFFVLNAVKFVDTLHGWAVGNAGRILYTSDGGSSWVEQTRADTNTLNDASFVAEIPQPAALLLVLIGLAGGWYVRHRQKRV